MDAGDFLISITAKYDDRYFFFNQFRNELLQIAFVEEPRKEIVEFTLTDNRFEKGTYQMVVIFGCSETNPVY